MSQKQLQRVKVIENVVEGRICIAQAASLLGLSARQVKRLKRRYADDNVGWVYHDNRGRPPVHRIGTPTRDPVIEWRAARMPVSTIRTCTKNAKRPLGPRRAKELQTGKRLRKALR